MDGKQVFSKSPRKSYTFFFFFFFIDSRADLLAPASFI